MRTISFASAMLALMTGAVWAVTPTPAKCDGGKVRCVGTYESALLGCHVSAEKSGDALDGACVQKAQSTFTRPAKGCIEKLDAKPPCSSSGADVLSAATDAFVTDVVTDLDPAYPAPVKDVCGAGKQKCVAALAKGLIGCEASNVRKPGATTLATCRAKKLAKFTTPAKGCFEKLEASRKHPCSTVGDAAVIADETTEFVASVVTAVLGPPTPTPTPSETPTPTATPSQTGETPAPTPSTAGTFLDFTVGAGGGQCGQIAPGPLPTGHLVDADATHLTCGALALGGGASASAESPSGSGATTRFALTACAGGSCTIAGVADDGLPAGVDGSKAGSSFGTITPVRDVAVPALSTCVRTVFAADASGSIDLDDGTVALNVDLVATTWVTGSAVEPCPTCTGYVGTPGPANPLTGTCDRGARMGKPCMTVSPVGLTTDCLPGGNDESFQVPDFDIDLGTLVTGTASMSDAGGVFCTGDADHQQAAPGCFGGNATQCTSISETGAPAGPLVVDVPSAVTLASVFCVPKAHNILVDGAASLPGPGALTFTGTLTWHP